jgi:tetratricopeptide (TPR) repeat protein
MTNLSVIPRGRRLTTFIAFLLLLTLSLAAFPSPVQQVPQAKSAAGQTSQNPADVRKLEVGKPIEREMKGGDWHTYEIKLEADQFLSAVVEQRGIDVVVQMIAPDGKQLVEVDSPNDIQGPEPIMIIAQAAGIYRIVVKSLQKNAAVGKYEITIIELRAARENDRILLEASKLNKDAEDAVNEGKLDRGIPLLEQVIALREKVLGDRHPDLLQSLNTLGAIYIQKGEYAKAEPFFLRALAIWETFSNSQKVEAVDLMRNLGELYRVRGDYNKSEAFFRRGLTISEPILGSDSLGVAQFLNSLGELYRQKYDFAQSEEMHLRALSIRKKLEPEGLDLSVSLNNLGLLYYTKGELEKARQPYLEALAIRKKKLGETNLFVATSLNNLGMLYLHSEDFENAELYLQNALSVRKKILPPFHPVVTQSMGNLAALYLKKADYLTAEEIFKSI